MSVKVPSEVVERVRFYRRQIPELLKKELVIEVDENNIIELLGFNIALNLCIERRVFNDKLAPEDILILNTLKDMKIYNKDRLIEKLAKLSKKRHSEWVLKESLKHLVNNGLIKEKGNVVGRGPCLILNNIYENVIEVMREAMYKQDAIIEFQNTTMETPLLINEKGELETASGIIVKNWEERAKLDEGVNRGIIKLLEIISYWDKTKKHEACKCPTCGALHQKKGGRVDVQQTQNRVKVSLELTDLGKYFFEVMRECEITD